MKIVWNQPKHIRSRATLALLSISPFAAWVIIELSKVTETNPPNMIRIGLAFVGMIIVKLIFKKF